MRSSSRFLTPLSRLSVVRLTKGKMNELFQRLILLDQRVSHPREVKLILLVAIGQCLEVTPMDNKIEEETKGTWLITVY
jgi:hypothetical protein